MISSFIHNLFYAILYLPGGLELTLSLLFFLALWGWRRKLSTQLLVRSLFLCVLCLFLGLSIGLHLLSGEFRPLLCFTYFLLSVLFYFAQKSNLKTTHWCSALAGILIYALCYWQFTFVQKEVKLPATWEIDDKSLEAAGIPLVTFQMEGNQSTSVFSTEIANLLKKQNEPQVILGIVLLYHWGRFAGHSLDQVNGQSFLVNNGFADFGCRAEPCSVYFLRPRGI